MYKISALIKVAEMYFYERIPQIEISKKINVSTATVSRMLKEALERGIIKVQISNPNKQIDDLSQRLKQKFHLKAAIVTSLSNEINNEYDLKKIIGKTAADYILTFLPPGSKVGIGPGLTVLEMVNSLQNCEKLMGLQIVPLMGGLGIEKIEYQVNKIASMLASFTGSRFHLLHAPAVVSSKKVKDVLLKEPVIVEITQMWDKLDYAIFSIGPQPVPSRNSIINIHDKDIWEEIIKTKGTGEILGRIFDEKGNECDISWNHHLIAIPFDTLRNIPIKIAISGGSNKLESIYVALVRGWIDILITDSKTCKFLLEREM